MSHKNLSHLDGTNNAEGRNNACIEPQHLHLTSHHPVFLYKPQVSPTFPQVPLSHGSACLF